MQGESEAQMSVTQLGSSSLFSHLIPECWLNHSAESALDREGCDFFFPSEATGWHVSRVPNGKAPTQKARLALGALGLGTGALCWQSSPRICTGALPAPAELPAGVL